jgi:ribosomal protein S18 acetylase RimI-like enzyme
MLEPDGDALVEDVLAEVLALYGHIPGASHQADEDLLWIRSGQPYGSMNHVFRLRMRPDAFADRVASVIGNFAPDSLPVTWWVGPTSEPADAADRLRGLGLREEEDEFGMVLELAGGPRADAPLPPTATLEAVTDRATLDGWMEVMAQAFEWPADGGKRRVYETLFAHDLDPVRAATRRHFLVRDGGRPAASSSVYFVGGHAFVTNIGAAPWARGRGLGTAATVATLRHAASLDQAAAVLVASVDGRGLYRRLGFQEYGVLRRFSAEAPLPPPAPPAPPAR